MYQKYFKRLIDIFLSLGLVIVFFPIIVLFFILIWIFNGFPIFFKQTRSGLHGVPFNIYKLRTMANTNNKNVSHIDDTNRITKLGQFLRSYSIDELPGLWNVLKGDMSLVGPRPLLMDYLPYYSEKQSTRHNIKPGITGWAQVNGRNKINWNEKFELDIWYLENQSLWLDIKILFLTIKKVLVRDNIYSKENDIMIRFDTVFATQKPNKKTTIAVISDIHSNLDALKVALGDLKDKKIDRTIFLGDILTYGCQPLEVLNMLEEYKNKYDTIFIKGNHDQLYFDLQSNIKKTNYKLPKFVDESVEWTLKKISPVLLKNIFSWRDNCIIGNIFFSHANPFLYGDWSYVEKPDNLNKSFQELRKKKVFAGVFGHSHRQLFFAINNKNIYEVEAYPVQSKNPDQLIVNAGSIGQPRGKGSGYIIMELYNNELYKANFKKLKINFSNSIKLIKETKFSKETKKKLIDYLKV